MADRSFLSWPFFDEGHRALARDLEAWTRDALPALLTHEEGDLDSVYACVAGLVRALGRAGCLRACVPRAYGGLHENVGVRSLCLARETLARASGLADFALAMQGLGSAPVSLFGNADQKQALLPGVASGDLIAAFALSEPDAGSDVAAMSTTARRDGDGWELDGVKTWISNGGIADRYVVFARTDASALLVYRSAWTRDVLGTRVTREASMAKLYATEAAQQVIDAAVQLHGGLGVVSGVTVERLYREIRALRIYEGATEVLQLIVGGKHLEGAHAAGG